MTGDGGSDERSAIGVGFDLDVERFGCAISNGTDFRVVSSEDGRTIPIELAVSSDGVLIGEAVADAPDDVSVARPFPQFEGTDERGRFEKTPSDAELPLARFFREGLEEWRRTARAVLSNHDAGTAIDRAFSHPVVGLPGSYTDEDAAQIRRIAANVGLDVQRLVRAPIPTALAHLLGDSTTEEGTEGGDGATSPVAVFHVDEFWCNVSFVELHTDPLEVDIRARTAMPNTGRESFVRELAEWVLDSAASEVDADPAVTAEGMAELRAAVDSAIDDAERGRIEVSASIDGITVGDAPLDVRQTIDATDGYAPLNDSIERIVERLEELRSYTAFDRSSFETVLLTGSGGDVPTIRRAIESYFEVEPRSPAAGTRDTAPTVGTALLAGAEASGRQVRITDTFGEDLGVEVLDGTDREFVEVASHAEPQTAEATVELAPARDNQVQGQAPFVTRHPVTGERTERGWIHVTGLPGSDAESVAFDVCIERDGTEYEASIRTPDGDDTVEAELVSGPLQGVPALRVPGIEVESTAADALFDSDRDGSAVYETDSRYDDVTTDRIVKETVDARNSLWRAIDSGDETLDAESIDALRRQIDAALGRVGISLVDPEIGEEAVGGRHEIKGVRPSERPQGTVVEVLEPGYEVEGRVEREAQVVVSDGTTPDSASEDESETEAESANSGADAPDVATADSASSNRSDSGTPGDARNPASSPDADGTPVTKPPEEADEN